MTKTHNYRLRVEPELHQAFLDACKFEDRPAAQVMREFMKQYVEKHKLALQGDLFKPSSKTVDGIGAPNEQT